MPRSRYDPGGQQAGSGRLACEVHSMQAVGSQLHASPGPAWLGLTTPRAKPAAAEVAGAHIVQLTAVGKPGPDTQLGEERGIRHQTVVRPTLSLEGNSF